MRISNFFLHLHPASVQGQGSRHTRCMGGSTFFLFLVEIVAGVLRMYYYRPTLEHACNDVLALRDVAVLDVLRELHRRAAHPMVTAVMLPMYRVFQTGSDEPPREFNRVIGVMLLVLTPLLSFMGYLHPWDKPPVWAIPVASNIVRGASCLKGRQDETDIPQATKLLVGRNRIARHGCFGCHEMDGTILPPHLRRRAACRPPASGGSRARSRGAG